MANCSCNLHPAVTKVGPFSICDAPVAGAWLLAVAIGVVGGAKLWRLGPSVVGSFSYSLIFYTYAVMISSGLVVHCLYLVECGVQPPTLGFEDFVLMDSSLTSCIAAMFLYSGLVDARLIKERGIFSFLALVTACGSIFYSNFNHLLSPFELYKWSIEMCCGGYVLIQCLLLIHKGLFASLWPITWLMCAAVTGGGSFYLLFRHYCWLCQKLGPWSIQGVWYYGSDVAMFFILLYVLSTRPLPSVDKDKNSATEKSTIA